MDLEELRRYVVLVFLHQDVPASAPVSVILEMTTSKSNSHIFYIMYAKDDNFNRRIQTEMPSFEKINNQTILVDDEDYAKLRVIF